VQSTNTQETDVHVGGKVSTPLLHPHVFCIFSKDPQVYSSWQVTIGKACQVRVKDKSGCVKIRVDCRVKLLLFERADSTGWGVEQC
jgi:hypothetical protein